MNVRIFRLNNSTKSEWDDATIRTTTDRIIEASNTPTDNLEVHVFFDDSADWHGAMYQQKFSSDEFHYHTRGEWKIVNSFDPPHDLPEKYALIRLKFGSFLRYPLQTTDQYDWHYQFNYFEDHLADLFAHELHHYRRYHLAMHHGEGEQSANKFVMSMTKQADFNVKGEKIISKKRRTKKKTIKIPVKSNPALLRKLKIMASKLDSKGLHELCHWADNRCGELRRRSDRNKRLNHYELLRSLPIGAEIRITKTGRISFHYENQIASKIKSLQRNSIRMKIKTPDGEIWRWPMDWLEAV